MSSYQTIETPQDYVNYTFNITSRGITEVSGEIAGLSNTVTTILGQLAFKTSEYLTHTESLVIGLGAASVAGFASATREAIKFEQAIANVQAIGGESINAMKIGQEAMKYSSQFGMDVNSMTEGLEALSRAGLTATDVMSGVLAEGVKLSKLEGMDLEDSINNLIATTNLLSTDELDVNSQEYADAVKAMNQHIVSTSESAPINAENIIQTLQHVGGYASANNIDQEDLFAVIAQLGAKGTKGEMAGTALRAFVAAGQKDQAQRALARIGLNVSDLWDESGEAMLPISEMKEVLDSALEARGYSKQEKLEFYADFAGYKQANQIMKIDTSEVKEYKETIAQAWDLGKKLETILGTTHNNIQTLYQTTKNFLTKVGRTVLPIINAIVIPLKWGVKLLDAMPFSENIVGILAATFGIKALLLFINRVIPTLASMYTNFAGAEKKAKGISGHVHDMVENLKDAKDILTHINDPIYLSNIRIQQGLMGEQSYKMHREVTKEVYEDLRIVHPELPDWNDLENFNQEAIADLMESYKKTDLYKQKQTIKTNKIKNINERLKELLLGKKETKKADVQWRKSNLDVNNEQHSNKTDDFVNATEAIQELAKNLEKTSDEKALEKSKNTEQRNITKSILDAKNALAEAIGREVSKQLNGKETPVSDTLGSFQMYDPKSSKMAEQLRQIESDVSNNLGDIGYFLNYDLEKIDNLLSNVRYDLQRKITAYTNNNPNFMNDEQDRRMSKIISGAAKTNLGRLYSTEQNNIDIHNVLTTGKWNNPGDKSSLGIHDEQMRAMEEALHIDVRDDLERTDRLNRIHKELNNKYQDDAKKDKIAEILKITQDIWEKDISHRYPSGVASQYLTNTRAAYIGNTLGLNGINWHQIENPAEELINYFTDISDNSKKQMQLKQADRLMFSIMEAAKSEEHIFNQSESDELGYLIRRYRQLLLARNKIIEEENKKEFINKNLKEFQQYDIEALSQLTLPQLQSLLNNPSIIWQEKTPLSQEEIRENIINLEDELEQINNQINTLETLKNSIDNGELSESNRNTYANKIIEAKEDKKAIEDELKEFKDMLVGNTTFDISPITEILNNIFDYVRKIYERMNPGTGLIHLESSQSFGLSDESANNLADALRENANAQREANELNREIFEYNKQRYTPSSSQEDNLLEASDFQDNYIDVSYRIKDIDDNKEKEILNDDIIHSTINNADNDNILDINFLGNDIFRLLSESALSLTKNFILVGQATEYYARILLRNLSNNTLSLPSGEGKSFEAPFPNWTTDIIAKAILSDRGDEFIPMLHEMFGGKDALIRLLEDNKFEAARAKINKVRYTQYSHPIGPGRDMTDAGRALQDKRIKAEQESKAHNELQVREAEKLAGITERYDKKMAEKKERLDKQAAERAAALRKERADKKDREDRERPLEDKIIDALHSSELTEAISLADKKEKKDAWDKRVENIKYNRHKNAQVTTLGMSGYYAYLNEIGYQRIQKEKENQRKVDNYNKIQEDLEVKKTVGLIKTVQKLSPLHQQLKDATDKKMQEENYKGATDALLDSQTKTSQYIKPIGPEPFKSVGDHNAAQESLRRLKERRYQQQVDAFGYGPGRGDYYAQINNIPDNLLNIEETTEQVGLTALEQAALMKKQNESLENQQKEFLQIAKTVSEQVSLKEKEKRIEEQMLQAEEQMLQAEKQAKEAYNDLLVTAQAITQDIKVRHAHGEVLSNEEIMALPNEERTITTKDGKTKTIQGVRDSEFERNPQRAMSMMFDRFDQEQASNNEVREPLSLLEREAYNATRMLFDRFEMAYEFIQNSMTAIAEILIGIHNQVLKLNSGPVTEYIDTRIVPPNLLGEGDSRDSTITMKGGVAYGGSEEDVRAWEEEWENIPEAPTYWEERAQQMKDSFENMGKSIDDFLDKKLSKFSDDASGLGKASRKVRLFTYDLESFQDAMTKAGKIFPPFLAIAAAMEGIVGVLSVITTGLATAETVLTAARMINTEVTKEEAKAEGKEAAWHMAQRIKQYTKGHKNIEKIIEKGAQHITRIGNMLIKGADKVLGFIIENIAILGPIAAAIAIAVGALWLSEQNHAKALKEATEEHEAAHKEAQASYITYKNLHEARKNEHDEMKRQQLARKESIALYKLETARIRQLNAIQKESDLRNDMLWGEYGLRAELQKQGFPFIGEFESQYEQYEGSTGEIRRIKEESLGNGGVMTTNQAAVSAWYDTHSRQLAQIEAFAPELQELYDLESRLIDKYGSKEAARNSKEFKEAVQEFSDATGLNRETAEKYLDYLQTEANVENARYAMQAEVNMIVSNAQAEAYKALYGDETGVGELDSVQDAMVYATADEIFKDAYQELWWSMLMEWLQSIYYAITLNWTEADKHAKAAGAYQDGMRELAENQQRITQEGVDIAKEDQRKEYESQSYSYYGDTPFGGAVASAAAAEQDYAAEAMNQEDMYYNASKSNGEAATQGFKDGLDQHSPGKIARGMEAEMKWSQEAIEKGGKPVIDSVYSVSNSISGVFGWLGGATNDALNTIFGRTSDVSNQISDRINWTGQELSNKLNRGTNDTFSNFSSSFNKPSNVQVDNSKTEIHIHTMNINTEDDPEKIKTAFMNLMIELGEQVVPRQVSRTVGEPPATPEPTTTDNQTEGTDAQNPDGTNNNDNNNNNSNSTNSTNSNPT